MSLTRTLQVEHVAPSALAPAPYNPRTMTDEARARLRRGIERFGLVDPIVARRQDGLVIGGHQRLHAAGEIGMETVPVVYLDDISDDEAAALNVLLNNPSAQGAWDMARLSDLLSELDGHGFDATLTGFDTDALEGILSWTPEVTVEPSGGEDTADLTPPEKPKSERGVIYELGPHRIMCGDCRDFEDVERLMAGLRVNVAVTSPPYASQRTYDPSSGFKPIPPDEYVAWYRDVAANVMATLAEDGSYFCNIKEHCEDGQRHLYVTDLLLAHVREWGWRWVDTFCWRDTRNGVPGGWSNRFKDAWEPVFHYTRGERIKFHPTANGTDSDGVFSYSRENAKSTSGSGLLGSEKAGGYTEGIARPSNVLDIPAGGTGEHAAQFPVDLPAWFIRAFSDPGDAIFDPFMGSGTTLVAAEKEGRVAYGMEISPQYVDVIRRRYAELVGRPELAP